MGHHLVRDLAKNGHDALALELHPSATHAAEAAETFTCDLRDPAGLNKIVASTKPDACIHLGAVSFVPDGTSAPDLVFSVNVLGTINVLDAFRQHAAGSRILVISSAHVYGPGAREEPIREDMPLAPMGMYAISKTAADLTALGYGKQYDMHIMTARPTNHTGPGQSDRFAVPSFARQIQAIAADKTQHPVLLVGNLESERDFSDVRDVARAYRLLIEKGHAGEAYNISSLNRAKLGAVLDELCKLGGVSPEIKVDPEKFRPTDSFPPLDITRLRDVTGWQAEISLSDTLRDILSEKK